MLEQPWYVPTSDFVARMEPADRDALLRLAHPRLYRRHSSIFQAGSAGNNVYLLATGRVKIYALSALGKQTILWFCFPGEVFGLAEMPRGGHREVYAEACTDCEVLAVSQRDFKEFLSRHPSTAMLTIELLSCRLRTLGDMLKNLSADDVETRVIKLLVRLCARFGRRSDIGADILLDIGLTHQEMADMIGATRQTVTSVLSDLKRKGVLRIENHCIRVHRGEVLEKLASGGAPALS